MIAKQAPADHTTVVGLWRCRFWIVEGWPSFRMARRAWAACWSVRIKGHCLQERRRPNTASSRPRFARGYCAVIGQFVVSANAKQLARDRARLTLSVRRRPRSRSWFAAAKDRPGSRRADPRQHLRAPVTPGTSAAYSWSSGQSRMCYGGAAAQLAAPPCYPPWCEQGDS